MPLQPEEKPRPTGPQGEIIPFQERRRDHRRPIQSKAVLTVLDGPGAGAVYEVQTRDLSLGGISFLLKEPLGVGQTLRVEIGNGNVQRHISEVVRCRLLSNGKYEMGVQFRKAV